MLENLLWKKNKIYLVCIKQKLQFEKVINFSKYDIRATYSYSKSLDVIRMCFRIRLIISIKFQTSDNNMLNLKQST